ncbi:MAG: hypothetical protein V6Z89_15565 [Desulfobacter sp.]
MSFSLPTAVCVHQKRRTRFLFTCCLFVALFMLFNTGCSSKAPTIKFKVKSDKVVNDGQPVYLLIRTISGSEFVTDDYDTIAALFHAYPTDESIVSTEFIIPGDTKKFVIAKPDDKDLGVYCMFTKPDAQWKLLLQKPLDKKYVILLENNEVRFD